MKKLKLNLKRIMSPILVLLGFMFIVSSCGPMPPGPPGPPPRLFGPGVGPEGVWFLLLLAIVGVAFWATQHRSNNSNNNVTNDKKEEKAGTNLLDELTKRFESLEKRLDKLEEKISEIKKQK